MKDEMGNAAGTEFEPFLDDEESLEALAPKRIEIRLSAKQGRERIDKFLTRQIENATRSRVQAAIEEGRVLVNGQPTKANYRVVPNDHIEVIFTHPPAPEMKPENIPLDIVFEDEWLMVINKPAGMVVHPAFGNWTGTLANAVLYHTARLSSRHQDDLRPGIVHRLDKDTSGLIVVAKDDETHYALAKQFAARTTEKRYQAIVWGVPKLQRGVIKTNIGRSKRDRKIMAAYPYNESETAEGKPAITEYEVVEDYAFFSLLSLTLHTGRTHQIRVHLQHLGHPILSDATYGGASVRALPFARSEAFVKNLFEVLPRQALHAAYLAFEHPKHKEKVSFTAPMPADMAKALEKIKHVHLSCAD